MPLMIDSPSLAMQLIQLFPEMRLHYGPEVKLVLGFKLQEDQTDQAIQFDVNRGIVFGDRALNDMKVYL